MTTPTASSLRQLARDVQRAREVSGIVSSQRLKLVLDALEQSARLLDYRRPPWLWLDFALAGTLATLTGAALAAVVLL